MDGPSNSLACSFLPWDHHKVFIGGIPSETDNVMLFEYFSQYGMVLESVAIKDRVTGEPRRFAFVVFSDQDAIDRVLNQKDPHVILGKQVEVNRARPRRDPNETSIYRSSKRSNAWSKKIFVGGLPLDITEDVFKSYFERFGTVVDAVVIYDRNTHRSRGFGFIEFELEDSRERVMQMDGHQLNNKPVEVRRAVRRDGSNAANASLRTGSGTGQGGASPTYGPRYGVYRVYPPPPPPPCPGYTFGPSGYGDGIGYVSGDYGRSVYGNAPMYPGYSNGDLGDYYPIPNGRYYGMVSGSSNGSQTGYDMISGSPNGSQTGYDFHYYPMPNGRYYGMVSGSPNGSQIGYDMASCSLNGSQTGYGMASGTPNGSQTGYDMVSGSLNGSQTGYDVQTAAGVDSITSQVGSLKLESR